MRSGCRTLVLTVLALFALVVLEMVIVVTLPWFPTPRQPVVGRGQPAARGPEAPPNRLDVAFDVDGETVRGWLYVPEATDGPVPGVVMAHGLGGTRDMAVEPFALRFADAGYAALTFDYRHWGDSDGEPRLLFSVPMQLDDVRGAVAFARARPEIDADRIVVWGTSAGGGYGLALAAEDDQIAGVIAQVPALDSEQDGELALEREGVGHFLALFVHAQRDRGRGRLGWAPHRIPLVGPPGSTALVTAEGALDGYAAIASPGFVNEVGASALFLTGGFNPRGVADQVRCPVLVAWCDEETLISEAGVQGVVNTLGDRARLHRYPTDHFGIYTGEIFEAAIEDQIAFLDELDREEDE